MNLSFLKCGVEAASETGLSKYLAKPTIFAIDYDYTK